MSDTIIISGSVIPSQTDTLLDKRTKVATFADIANIENPARFLVITVEETGRKYEVKKLTSKVIGGILVENAGIDINDPDALFDLGLAEEQRVEDEKVRQANEFARVQAESSRVVAEQERAEIEAQRASRESVRQSNEDTRQSNEESRKEAETARVSAESARKSNESVRQSNEFVRESSESYRVSNESLRVNAESDRVEAENARVIAENARVEAENARVVAESGRVTEFEQSKAECDAAAASANEKAQAVTDAVLDISSEKEKAIAAAASANDAAAAAAAATNECREVIAAGSLDIVPTSMKVTYPSRITYGNQTEKGIKTALYPASVVQNVLFLGSGDAVDVAPDGRLTVKTIGKSTIHVIPPSNTSLYKTIQVEVVTPAMRFVNSNKALRFTGSTISLV